MEDRYNVCSKRHYMYLCAALLLSCFLCRANMNVAGVATLAAARGGVGHPSITVTRTLGSDGHYVVSPSVFDEQAFLRPRLFPAPTIVVNVFNDTIMFNSRACQELLSWYSIRGPGYGATILTDEGRRERTRGFYVSSIAPTTNYLSASSSLQISIGGKLWTREQVKHFGLTSGIVMTFAGDTRFNFRDAVVGATDSVAAQRRSFVEQFAHDDEDSSSEEVFEFRGEQRAMSAMSFALSVSSQARSATYSFTLPSSCLMSQSPPAGGPATFVISENDRDVLGQVMSFFIMISGVLCALSTLVGSLTPLFLLQTFAALTMISCAPPSLLAETYFTHYALFPSRTWISDFGLNESTVIIMGAVAGCVVLLELVHYIFENRSKVEERYETSERRMAEAAAAAMRDAAKRGVRLRSGMIGTKDGDEDDDGVFDTDDAHRIASRKGGDVSDDDTDSSWSGRSRRARAASRVEETLQSVRDTAAAAASEVRIYLPMSPYVGSCVLCGILVGMIVHCSTIVFSGGESVAMLGVSVLGLLLFGAGMCMFSLGVLMRKSFLYCRYREAQSGLPASMHVSGVWGPNNLRLRFGIFCEDFREGRRNMSVITLVYGVAVGILSGSSPTSRGGCTTVLGIAAVLTFSYGLLSFVLWPLRSRMNNFCLLGANVATFMYECCMLAFVADVKDTTSPTPPSIRGALVCGSLVCVASIVAAVSRLITAFWEIKGSRAAKYTSLHHAEEALDAEMTKLQTELEVEEGVEKTLEMYRVAAREAEEDDGDGFHKGSGIRGGGLHSFGYSGLPSGGSKRIRMLERARDEALAKARQERITGMRYAHDTVRAGASLAIGDERHPSYADFLLVDYHLVPEETRHEFRTIAQVRRAAERAEGVSNALARLSFEEQMILQGRSQHRPRGRSPMGDQDRSLLSTSASVSVPHIYSTSVLPSLSPSQARLIAEEQRKQERYEQHRSIGRKIEDDDL